MKEVFLMIYKDGTLRVPSKIIKKLNIKKGDVLEIQISKIYVEETTKKELANLLD